MFVVLSYFYCNKKNISFFLIPVDNLDLAKIVNFFLSPLHISTSRLVDIWAAWPSLNLKKIYNLFSFVGQTQLIEVGPQSIVFV
jgi:hypothetical protein